MLKIQIQCLAYYKNTKFHTEDYRQDFCNPLHGVLPIKYADMIRVATPRTKHI